MYDLLFYGVPVAVMVVALLLAILGPRFYLKDSDQPRSAASDA
ncbi:hypothetical protein ABZZ74_53820 [Streptomyces sp. NPDC006476]